MTTTAKTEITYSINLGNWGAEIWMTTDTPGDTPTLIADGPYEEIQCAYDRLVTARMARV